MMFPSSIYLLHQFVKLDRDSFTKYAVCPECTKIYPLDQCTVRVGNRIEARTCTNRPFRSGRKSQECGAILARKVVTGKNRVLFYPLKIYCVNSVINQLECILKRPNIPDLCEQWRQRRTEPGLMADLFDGKIWKDFSEVGEKEFLKTKRNIALGINVDWFQPYKRRKDRSVDVIYFILLNLPREERYKWENIIVAGIIPEMKKEPKSINSFLDPIIDELQALWKGVKLQTSASRIPLLYRAALLLASSDIPASRKLCGFKGHSANRGCSKCFKFFPGSFSQKTDYSGFDVDNWPPRDNITHRLNASKVKNAENKTKHEKLAKTYGVYYSSLLKLEYFDAVRFTAIDPMHNLFLGTAKHLFKLWVEKDILSKKSLQEIDKRISQCDVPTGFGRLPSKIASNYGCYTASQWKNWTLIYSMYCLNGLLPQAHLRCWQTFVLACQYLSQHIISEQDITIAGGLFVKFGKEFQQLYGNEKVTPNMHLHCHLKECALDFGPLHGFWCFSFERFNGILGATQMNGRSIEVQLMRKLIVGRFIWNAEMPTCDFKNTFMPFFSYCGTDDNYEFSSSNAMYFSKSASCQDLKDIDWDDLSLVFLPKSFQYLNIDPDDLQLLLNCYKQLLPTETIAIDSLSTIARKYAFVFLGTEKFGSKRDNKSLRSSRVMASWADDDGSIKPSISKRPGQVNFYILHSLTVDGVTRQFVLACVYWHKRDDETDFYGKPTEVWRLKEFDTPGPATFMPVQRIANTFAAVTNRRNGVEKLVISPIPRIFT